MKQLSIFILISMLMACSAEKKALKPYNKVLTDKDTSFGKLKLQAVSDICDKYFPIEVKTITKDSIIETTVYATKFDTLIVGDTFYITKIDTLIKEKFTTKEITQKDTVENYRLKQIISQLNNNLFDLDTTYKYCKASEIKALNEVKELKEKSKNISYLLGCIWDLTKWWLILILGSFLGFKLITKTNIISLIKRFIKW